MHAARRWMVPAIPSRSAAGPRSALLPALAAAARGLLAAAPYVPFLPASLSLLAAPPAERVKAVRRVRERESFGLPRAGAVASVARGLGLTAGTVECWLLLAERDARRGRLVVRRRVRGARTA